MDTGWVARHDGRLYARDRYGFWHPVTDRESAAVRLMAVAMDGAGLEPPQIRPLIHAHVVLMARIDLLPDLPDLDDIAAHPAVRTLAGLLDLDTGDEITDPDVIAGYHLTAAAAGGGFRCRRGDLPDKDFMAHYCDDDGRDTVLRRIALSLLGPGKRIDSVVMPMTEQGKSTLADALPLALPGLVTTDTAVRLFSPQSARFTGIEVQMARYRLVVADEADKIESPPPPGMVSSLTDDFLTVEEKMLRPRRARRLGTLLLMGADWAVLTTSQGTDSRRRWAYRYADDHPTIDASTRRRWHDPDHVARLASWLCDQAIQLSLIVNPVARVADTETAATRGWAAAQEADGVPVDIAVLRDAFEIGEPGDFVPTSDLLEALREAGVPVPQTRAMAGLLDRAFPGTRSSKKQIAGVREPGRVGIRATVSVIEGECPQSDGECPQSDEAFQVQMSEVAGMSDMTPVLQHEADGTAPAVAD